MNKTNICGDCGVNEGELHQEGCDMEHCIKCKDQKMCCDCGYDTEREPYFYIPLICVRCGKLWPDLFMVSNGEWNIVCGMTFNKEDILCRDCFVFIKKKRENIKCKTY